MVSQIRTFLAGATTMASALAAVFFLARARVPIRHEKFDEITVGRINIVEPDGTKRIVISSKAQFPGDFMQGKEGARPDRNSFAGMLFINEEGTENGGLIQKGSIAADGKISSSLSGMVIGRPPHNWRADCPRAMSNATAFLSKETNVSAPSH